MSEKETLTSRMIDRPMRPLFPEGYLNETQIIAMVLSADPEHDPGVLAIVGAGAALAISDIPFHHLVSAVRVGMVDGKYVANPTYTEGRASKLNMIVAAAIRASSWSRPARSRFPKRKSSARWSMASNPARRSSRF
jgi:polyribonucleotide nucleotidyltransferase